MKALGRRLAEVRETERLSQEEFIRRLGRGTQRALANYERGEVLPPADLIHAVCREFDVSFHWLMTGSGAQKESALRAGGQRDIVHEVRHAIRSAVAELDDRSQKNEFPNLGDSQDLVIVALRLAMNRFDWYFSSDRGPEGVGKFIQDLVFTLRELLGEAPQMKVDSRFMKQWATLDRREQRLKVLDLLFPRRTRTGKRTWTKGSADESRRALEVLGIHLSPEGVPIGPLDMVRIEKPPKPVGSSKLSSDIPKKK